MLLPGIRWPLQSNAIRKRSVSNTFGMVRNGGTRVHQGWDLLAYPGTRCFAVAEGEIALVERPSDYGLTIIQRFEYRGRVLFAVYAHLSICPVSQGKRVYAGECLGLTGNTGNADTMAGDNQHLHFEIRTVARTGRGLVGRIDPRSVYGCVPLSTTIVDSRSPDSQKAGTSAGLKVQGVTVL